MKPNTYTKKLLAKELCNEFGFKSERQAEQIITFVLKRIIQVATSGTLVHFYRLIRVHRKDVPARNKPIFGGKFKHVPAHSKVIMKPLHGALNDE